MPHVTFIHGLANKPAAGTLLRLWRDALAYDGLGNDDSLDLGALGVSSSMVYWADVLYDEPLDLPILEHTDGRYRGRCCGRGVRPRHGVAANPQWQ